MKDVGAALSAWNTSLNRDILEALGEPDRGRTKIKTKLFLATYYIQKALLLQSPVDAVSVLAHFQQMHKCTSVRKIVHRYRLSLYTHRYFEVAELQNEGQARM